MRVLHDIRLGKSVGYWVHESSGRGVVPPPAQPAQSALPMREHASGSPELALARRSPVIPAVAVVGVGWKWDGTPVSAHVRSELVVKELGAEVRGLDLWARGKGAECFCQRGCLVRRLPNGRPVKIVIPVPAKPLGDKHADAMLAALEFETAIACVIRNMQAIEIGRAHV